MISVAEKELSVPGSNGQKFLCVWTNQSNIMQQRVLNRRGYVKFNGPESAEHLHKRDLEKLIPDSKIPPGYTLCELDDVGDVPARSWASWRAFHSDDPDENYDGWDWYLNVQQIPTYRRDLDIVAIAPIGEIASFCTVWYDDVTQSGYIEPVGTVPDYQRKGLARAVLYEGMRRLKQVGGRVTFVGGYSQMANILYEKVAGRPYDMLEPWIHRELEKEANNRKG